MDNNDKNEIGAPEPDMAGLLAVDVGADPGPEPGQPGQAGPVLMPTKELLLPAIEMMSVTVFSSWQLQAAECEQLAESYGAVIDKYFPGGAGELGPELSAVIVTAMVVLPRYKQDNNNKKENINLDEAAE